MYDTVRARAAEKKKHAESEAKDEITTNALEIRNLLGRLNSPRFLSLRWLLGNIEDLLVQIHPCMYNHFSYVIVEYSFELCCSQKVDAWVQTTGFYANKPGFRCFFSTRKQSG